jgi:hypothetical protein
MTFRVALTFDAEHLDRPTEYDAAVARLRAGLVETAIVRMRATA